MSMLLSMGSVFAEGVESDTDYVVTYSAEEITEINELIDIGINSSATRSISNDTQIEVKQLLETRVYNDGHTEKEYTVKGIIVANENGIPMTRSQIMARNSNSNSSSMYGVTATCILNYTESFNNVRVFRVDNVQTAINYSGQGIAPSYGNHGYNAGPNHDSNAANFSCSISSYQSFYLPSLHSNFYPSAMPYEDGVLAGSTVYLTNGSYLNPVVAIFG